MTKSYEKPSNMSPLQRKKKEKVKNEDILNVLNEDIIQNVKVNSKKCNLIRIINRNNNMKYYTGS